MLLRVYSSNKVQVIRLSPQFFTSQKEYKGGRLVILTPKEKAKQLALALGGGKYSYRGHILEEDGEVIANTLEKNKDLEQKTQRDDSKNKSKLYRKSASSSPGRTGYLPPYLRNGLR